MVLGFLRVLPRLITLEFAPEADGTGIEAESREDLERALGVLGLR